MNNKTALIITTISPVNNVLLEYAKGCKKNNWDYIIIGDKKTPDNFSIDHADYWNLEKQVNSSYQIAKHIPLNHYARKNIGYLIAMSNGCDIIVETDDDNIPKTDFWLTRTSSTTGIISKNSGWLNVYKHFSNGELIWPRGFHLDKINQPDINLSTSLTEDNYTPIQQGLADENPDVDAIYRLTRILPYNFKENVPLSIGVNTWCPFNSQNTTWFKEAFPLMYLPSFCSFRMTDIWRSFIAQRIAWEYNWNIKFHNANVYQERNEHCLMKDFKDEVDGFLRNDEIIKTLEKIKLSPKKSDIFHNLKNCYQELIQVNVFSNNELELLNLWIEDQKMIQNNEYIISDIIDNNL